MLVTHVVVPVPSPRDTVPESRAAGGAEMKNESVRLVLASLTAACVLAACPRPVAAYIKVEPLTLGNLCSQSQHIYVLKVEKVDAEKGVILFQTVEQLKGKPDNTAAKHVIGPKVEGAKIILDWAVEGKTAVIFCNVEKGYGRGHAYIDGYWYWMTYEGKYWTAGAGEPAWLSRYCGTADKLRDPLAKILRGDEVVVPCMVNDDKKDLEQRRAKVQRVRASLKILDYDAKRDFVGWGAEEK
jgi:hypothetical protein